MSFAIDREQLDQESEHLEHLADEPSLQEARMHRAHRQHKIALATVTRPRAATEHGEPRAQHR